MKREKDEKKRYLSQPRLSFQRVQITHKEKGCIIARTLWFIVYGAISGAKEIALEFPL